MSDKVPELFVFKQSYKSRNRPTTRVLNQKHLVYIATRPGVMRNPECGFGLWGKLPGMKASQNIDDLRTAYRAIGQASEGHTVYRAILSVDKNTAKDYGCRITILKDGQKVYSMNWSNQPEAASVKASFVRKNKLDYLHGATLAPASTSNPYTSTVVPRKIPTIVGGAGGNNIEAIKRYFTEENCIRSIAGGIGVPYDELTGGHYKLLLEPIAYFTFKGIKWAMTATEAAEYDVLINGQLRAWMKSLTHQNLPLSMFLEKTDTELNLEKWTGVKSGKQTDADIIHYLGMGIVFFKTTPPVVPSDYDYEFRTDTDVIISFPITSSTEITPEDGKYVTMSVGGHTCRKNFICPEGQRSLSGSAGIRRASRRK